MRSVHNRRLGTVAAASLLLVWLIAPDGSAVTGNINPGAIEIEKAGKANVVAGTANADVFNPAADLDWVKDATANSGTNCLAMSIASCNQAGVTAAAGGTGHWQGVRIVDGISGGNEQDIFLTGGKENDLSSWNVGGGSVGSSKYDATQMYLANNQTDLFFGMERAGNNGTTAFDFEFNRNAPATAGSYVPTRTAGDVLFTFEMQGSGGSGSVTPHFYRYTAGGYTEQALPAGTFSSINDNTTTAGEPWGHVNSHGNWVLGNLDRNTFAEAVVNLANVFPGFAVCGDDSAYVQIRTRSSSTDTSDLKDTTKIFNYEFNPPASPSTQLASTCSQTFTYNSPGTASAYDWDFVVSAAQAAAGVTLSGTGVTGPATAGNGDKVYDSALQSGTVSVNLPSGVASASVEVSQTTTNAASCEAGDGPFTVTVYRTLGVTATLAALCDNQFTYASTVTGGNAPYTYAWTFQKNSAADGTGSWSTAGTSAAASGTFTASSAGRYRALLTVTDTAGTSTINSVTPKPVCQAQATSNEVNVYAAVGGTTTLATTCATPDVLSYSATGTGGNGTYDYAWTIQKNTGTQANPVWVTAGTFTDGPTSGASTGTIDVDSFAVNKGDGFYRALVTVTDTQGLNCHADPVSNVVEAAHALGATAAKTSADGSTLVVNLTGGATNGGSPASGAAYSYQWQKSTDGSTWTNVSTATATTLAYSSFAADATPSATSFTVASGAASGSYAGQLWTVYLRLRVTRAINGVDCVAESPGVIVKKVTAVDP
ncbi:MAG TPA: hypothetical protein VNQ77_11920 [Frankiaceae bacterium]|nr:hypothetical protein [Frankiaceae bacterium]